MRFSILAHAGTSFWIHFSVPVPPSSQHSASGVLPTAWSSILATSMPLCVDGRLTPARMRAMLSPESYSTNRHDNRL